jgi:hypothetical protein
MVVSPFKCDPMLNPDIRSHRIKLLQMFEEYRDLLDPHAIQRVKSELGYKSLASDYAKIRITLSLIQEFGTPKEIRSFNILSVLVEDDEFFRETDVPVVQEKPLIQEQESAVTTLELLVNSPLFRLFNRPKTLAELRQNTKTLLIRFHPDSGSGDEECYSELTRISSRLQEEWSEIISLPKSSKRIQRMLSVEKEDLPESIRELI